MHEVKNTFTVLAKVPIQDKRNAVISENSRGQIAIAQQIIVTEGYKTIGLFLKGSILIDPQRLLDFRDAINEAISALEKDDKEII